MADFFADFPRNETRFAATPAQSSISWHQVGRVAHAPLRKDQRPTAVALHHLDCGAQIRLLVLNLTYKS